MLYYHKSEDSFGFYLDFKWKNISIADINVLRFIIMIINIIKMFQMEIVIGMEKGSTPLIMIVPLF